MAEGGEWTDNMVATVSVWDIYDEEKGTVFLVEQVGVERVRHVVYSGLEDKGRYLRILIDEDVKHYR